jgi:hypothetical protein
MKRRKLMRLLAVVMAVSLAVTSQGIPAGLTAVYADTPAVNTAVTKQNGLTAGHLYQELTTADHTHAEACYAGTAGAVAVVAADKYYKAAESTTQDAISVGSDYYVKVATGTYINPGVNDVDVTETALGTNFINLVGGEYKVYTGTALDASSDSATISSIEEALSSAGKTKEIGATQTVSATEYTLVKDKNGTLVWISGANEGTQPTDGVVKENGIFLQVVTEATPDDPDVTLDFKYKPIGVDASSHAVAQASDFEAVAQSKVIQDTSDTDKYYIDVTANYVTGIEVVNTDTQYVTTATAETELDDSVKLTFGIMGYTKASVTLAKDLVTSSSTFDASSNEYDGTPGNVTIGTIKANDTKTDYMYSNNWSAEAGAVVTTSTAKRISEITDFSSTVTGLSTGKAAVTVKRVTAPTMTLSDPTGTTPLDNVESDGNKDFDVTSGTATVAAPSLTIDDDVSSWTFKWRDVAEQGSTTETGAASSTALTDYVLNSSSTLGKHTVSLVALYKGQEVAESATKVLYIKKQVTLDTGVTYVQADNSTGSKTAPIEDWLSPYSDGGNFSSTGLSKTSGEASKINGDAVSLSGTDISYQIDTALVADEEYVFEGTITNTMYILNTTFKLSVKSGAATDITANAKTIYYGDKYTSDSKKKALLAEIVTSPAYDSSKYEVTFGGTTDTTVPTAVGTYTVYVTYASESDFGSATTTLTVAQKPLTVTAQDQVIKKGGAITPTKYTVKSTQGDTVASLPSGLTAKLQVFDGTTDVTSSVSTLAEGKYTIEVSVTGSAVENYTISYEDGNLTIGAAGSSTGSGDKNGSDNSNEEGSATNPVVNVELKTVDGVLSLVTDDGTVLKNQFATVGTKLYYADADGAVQTGKIFTVGSKKYYATKTGAIRKNGVYDIVGGGKIYARADGTLLVSGSKVIDGDRYVADKNGKLVKSGFTTTAKGYRYCMKNYVAIKNKVFTHTDGKTYIANKNGTIQKGNKIVTFGGKKYYVYAKGSVAKNKVVTVSGKKYVANKKGVLVINGKYTIGKKTYTTNKKGVITKTTTKK